MRIPRRCRARRGLTIAAALGLGATLAVLPATAQITKLKLQAGCQLNQPVLGEMIARFLHPPRRRVAPVRLLRAELVTLLQARQGIGQTTLRTQREPQSAPGLGHLRPARAPYTDPFAKP